MGVPLFGLKCVVVSGTKTVVFNKPNDLKLYKNDKSNDCYTSLKCKDNYVRFKYYC